MDNDLYPNQPKLLRKNIDLSVTHPFVLSITPSDIQITCWDCHSYLVQFKDCITAYISALRQYSNHQASNQRGSITATFPTPSQDILDKADNNEVPEKYLVQLYKLYKQCTTIERDSLKDEIIYSLNCVNDDRYISKDILTYYGIYIRYKLCLNVKVFSYKSFQEFIEKFNTIESNFLKQNILKMIGRCITGIPNIFYIDDSLNEIISSISDSEFKEDMILSIKEARTKFFTENMDKIIIHEITGTAFSIYEGKTTAIPAELSSKIKLPNWPQVTISADKNYFDNSEIIIDGRPSINCLLRFVVHLNSPTLFIFDLAIRDCDTECLKEVTEYITGKLIEEGFLNSAGQFKKELLYNTDRTNINPAKYKETIVKCLKEKFIPFPWTEEQINNILQESCLKALNTRKVINELSLFNSLSAISMMIQTLESVPHDLPTALDGCLLDNDPREIIVSKLYDTLLIAYQAFLINDSTQDLSARNQLFFNLATSVVNNKFSESNFEGLILQSGDPIKQTDLRTKHAFYVIIQQFGNKFKIVIVNGGSNAYEDPQFINSDRGFGSFWLCQTLVTKEKSPEVLTFIKHFMYSVISLRYSKSTDKVNFKLILGNIYLKNARFIGYDRQYSEDEFKAIVNIENDDKCPSFPSQVFDNCTIHNLKQALKIYFNWGEHQFALFAHDLFCRYNYLLNNQASVINPSTSISSSTVQNQDGSSSIVISDDMQGEVYDSTFLATENNKLFLAISEVKQTSENLDERKLYLLDAPVSLIERLLLENNPMWQFKKWLYSRDITKFNQIMHKYNLARSVDELKDAEHSSYSFSIELEDKELESDVLFVATLKEKLNLPTGTKEIEYLQPLVYKANMGLKVADIAVDVTRLLYMPTVDNAQKTLMDVAHIYSMYTGINGFSVLITSYDVINKFSQGGYTQAISQAATSISYAVLPTMIASFGAPYIGFGYSIGFTIYTGYHTVLNARSFYYEFNQKDFNLNSNIAYQNIAEKLSTTYLQNLYDFTSKAKEYEKTAYKIKLEEKGEFGKKLYEYIYSRVIDEKYDLQNNLKSKHIKVIDYDHCMEIIELKEEDSDHYYCYNEEQQILDHIVIIGEAYINKISSL